MPFRLIIAIVSLVFLAACTTSGYTPSRAAASFPPTVKIIRFDKVDFADTSRAQLTPSDAQSEILARVKADMTEAFRRQGITLAGDATQQPDLTIQVIVNYTPELGLVQRSLIMDMFIATPDGLEIGKERYADASVMNGGSLFNGGIWRSMLQSRDDVIDTASRSLVEQAVADIRKAKTGSAPAVSNSQ
jgi:hypothetical protein